VKHKEEAFMEEPVIHPRLLDDCHCLGRLPHSALLLQRNAALPWFILVPRTELEDVLDLPGDLLLEVVTEAATIAAFIKRELGYDKVNFAGLGNVVPQMHLHVIGRRPGDACWPQPVWGNLPDGGSYAPELLREWCARLEDFAGLVVPGPGCP
jgi:diadenosine tetraphosphate (Ap4A) HIT family hydrolase